MMKLALLASCAACTLGLTAESVSAATAVYIRSSAADTAAADTALAAFDTFADSAAEETEERALARR